MFESQLIFLLNLANIKRFFFLPGNDDSFNATSGEGAADDDKLSFDRFLSPPLFCE